jgi:chaperonin GroEL (HSP60 family)
VAFKNKYKVLLNENKLRAKQSRPEVECTLTKEEALKIIAHVEEKKMSASLQAHLAKAE